MTPEEAMSKLGNDPVGEYFKKRDEEINKLRHSEIPIKRTIKKLSPELKESIRNYDKSLDSEVERLNSDANYPCITQVRDDNENRMCLLKILLSVSIAVGLIVFHVWRVGTAAEQSYMTGFEDGIHSVK